MDSIMKRTEKPIEYNYRGRRVQIVPPGQVNMNGLNTLMIDDKSIEYTHTEDGVYSHTMMFQVFGTPYELAEAIIRDWGTADVQMTPMSHDDQNGHEHGDSDDHNPPMGKV